MEQDQEKEQDNQGKDTSLDSWSGFLGSNFLNAEDVRDENHEFVVTGTELDTENNRPLLLLESEGLKTKFSLNVTNANFMKEAGIKSPADSVGKIITFRKVMVNSPKKKREVESLRIRTVRDPKDSESSEKSSESSE